MFTNAMHNRKQAIKMIQAGFNASDIVRHFALVWFLEDGKLSQIYDQTLSDGRKETSISMSSFVVDQLIKEKEKKNA